MRCRDNDFAFTRKATPTNCRLLFSVSNPTGFIRERLVDSRFLRSHGKFAEARNVTYKTLTGRREFACYRAKATEDGNRNSKTTREPRSTGACWASGEVFDMPTAKVKVSHREKARRLSLDARPREQEPPRHVRGRSPKVNPFRAAPVPLPRNVQRRSREYCERPATGLRVPISLR